MLVLIDILPLPALDTGVKQRYKGVGWLIYKVKRVYLIKITGLGNKLA